MPNETYEIEVGSPLLRPGITIRTYVSKKYVASTTKDLLNIIRDINISPNEIFTSKDQHEDMKQRFIDHENQDYIDGMKHTCDRFIGRK